MKVPISWLQEFLPNVSKKKIVDALMQLGVEVDGVYSKELSFKGVITARVLDCSPHPNADSLKVAKVFDGVQEFDVVCGAPNCRRGIISAFAPCGAKLDVDGKAVKISKAKLRGVVSEGMLCSARELSIGSDDDGIVEFDSDICEGVLVEKIFGDDILEVSLTPNLGHCQSVFGLAREVAAVLNAKVELPIVDVEEESLKSVEEEVEVDVEDEEKCDLYCCRIVENVKVGASPLWIIKKLQDCGIRAVNNVVDITNYVMMYLGTPLHAFDFDKVSNRILVRSGIDGEKIECLDGECRKLSSEVLLIRDDNGPIAVGGIIGGEKSKVDENSSTILLECARFSSKAVRRGRKFLKLFTESSQRFERGIDVSLVKYSLDLAARLIRDICEGKILRGRIVKNSKDAFYKREVMLGISRVNDLLETKFSSVEVEEMLNRLEFVVKSSNDEILTVEVPLHRNDVNIEDDLVEEVARLYGYDNISKTILKYSPSSGRDDINFTREKFVRNKMVSLGFQEVMGCDIINKKDVMGNVANVVKVSNPQSEDYGVLRSGLLGGLLEIVSYNTCRGNKSMRIFESGKRYFVDKEGCREEEVVGMLMSGNREVKQWINVEGGGEVDLFDIKGVIEILTSFCSKNVDFKESQNVIFHPCRRCDVFVDGNSVGTFGEIHPRELAKFDIDFPVYFSEIPLNVIDVDDVKNCKMKHLATLPGSARDFTVEVDEKFAVGELVRKLRGVQSALLEEVSLKYVYCGENAAQGKKNVTIHFFYRDRNKTISSKDVDKEHSRILDIAKNLGYFL